jgi:hypothetical protein
MEFIEHLSISLVLGVIISFFIEASLEISVFIVATSIISGSFMDLDHFLISRFRDGNWEKLRTAIKNPTSMVSDNESLIGEKWLDPFLVVKTHLLELSILAVLLMSIETLLLSVAFVSLVLHVLCDVWADWRKGYLGDYPG